VPDEGSPPSEAIALQPNANSKRCQISVE
jgi:hypothetical protein